MRRNRSRAALFAAELISTTGTQAAFVALPWFVLVQTDSLARMSYVLAAELAPVALLGIVSGAVVEALGARRTLLFCDTARALLIGMVPALYWSKRLDFPHLLALVIALGLFTAPHVAARRAILTERSGAGLRVATLVGPALGGVLVAAYGPPWTLVVVAAAYLAAALVVVLLVSGTESLETAVPARTLPMRASTALALLAVGAAVNALLLSLPALAYLRFDRNPHVAGWLLACFGAGTLVGTPLAARALRRVAPMRLARAATFAVASMFWLLAVDLPWEGTAALLLATGLLVPFANGPIFGSFGRAAVAVSALGAPLGRVAIGPLFAHASIATTYTVVATAMSVGAILFGVVALSASEEVPVHSPAWH